MPFDSFVKAIIAYFGDPKVSVTEFKSLTNQDKIDLSTELNKVPGYEHPLYVPKPTTDA